jgi:hypothetical protein
MSATHAPDGVRREHGKIRMIPDVSTAGPQDRARRKPTIMSLTISIQT